MNKLHVFFVLLISIILAGCQIERLEIEHYHDILIEAGFTFEEVDQDSFQYETMVNTYSGAKRFLGYTSIESDEIIHQGGIIIFGTEKEAKVAIVILQEVLNDGNIEDFKIKVIGNFLFVGDSVFFETLKF